MYYEKYRSTPVTEKFLLVVARVTLNDSFILTSFFTDKIKSGVEIELTNFIMPLDDVPEEVRHAITHWSQWIDYWAVDWDYKDDLYAPRTIKAMSTNVASYVVCKEFEKALKDVIVEEVTPELTTPARMLSTTPPFPFILSNYGDGFVAGTPQKVALFNKSLWIIPIVMANSARLLGEVGVVAIDGESFEVLGITESKDIEKKIQWLTHEETEMV